MIKSHSFCTPPHAKLVQITFLGNFCHHLCDCRPRDFISFVPETNGTPCGTKEVCICWQDWIHRHFQLVYNGQTLFFHLGDLHLLGFFCPGNNLRTMFVGTLSLLGQRQPCKSMQGGPVRQGDTWVLV